MPNHRFGKHPPKVDYRTLRLKSYLTSPTLAPPPACWNVLAAVFANLKTHDPTKLFPMDGNDTMGGLHHRRRRPRPSPPIRGLGSKTNSCPRRLSRNSTTTCLAAWTRSARTGRPQLLAQAHGAIDGDKIMAYASVDPKNHTHVQQAIKLFGGVYLGFQVQQNCIQEFDAHQPWTPGPLTQGGHAVFAVAYDQNGVTVLTWGNTQEATWAWWDECVDEAYAILPPEAAKAGFAPGFDVAELQTDLANVAS